MPTSRAWSLTLSSYSVRGMVSAFLREVAGRVVGQEETAGHGRDMILQYDIVIPSVHGRGLGMMIIAPGQALQ